MAKENFKHPRLGYTIIQNLLIIRVENFIEKTSGMEKYIILVVADSCIAIKSLKTFISL
jgi:hypothetical protein